MSGNGDITGDEFIRDWFAQSQGLDIGSVDRSTFLNLKDFEKMLTGPVAQSRPGSFDPAAFQPIVTGYDEVVLPQRSLFNQVMMSDGSPERHIALMLEGSVLPDGTFLPPMTPMALERQLLEEERSALELANEAGGRDKELDEAQEAKTVANVGKMVSFAERLYSEKMDYDKAAGQLSPDAAQYAAANPGVGIYRQPITEESPAAKFYTERGLPTPDQEWTIDDVSPGYSERQAGRDRFSEAFRGFQAEMRESNAAERASRAAERARRAALDKRLREQSWETYKASQAPGTPEATTGGLRKPHGGGAGAWGQEGEFLGSVGPAIAGMFSGGDGTYAPPPDHGDGAGMIGQRGELFGSVNPMNWSMFGGDGSAPKGRAVKAVPSSSGLWRQAQANHDAKKDGGRPTAWSIAGNEAADERRAAFEKLLEIRNADYFAQGAELTRANGELQQRNRQGLTPLTYAMQQATSSGSRNSGGGGGGGAAADIVAAWNAKGAASKANRSGLARQASGGGMSPIVAALLARSGR
jgi:hypothetical protein